MQKYISTKLGYGNPKGDFWFIGPEEGGDASSLIERVAIWNALGEDKAFQDLRGFHLAYKNGTESFFEGKIKLQKTWNGIIEVLFGIEGNEASVSAKKAYQSMQLGSLNGNTLLAELFPFASQKLNDKDWLSLFGETKNQYWNKYSNTRIALLTAHIETYKPKAVVFYSTSFSNYWLTIISNCKGEKLDIQRPDLPLSLYKSDSTLFAIIPHPVSIQMNGTIKSEIGAKIRMFL
jgi:hypothetical protein